VSSRVFSKSRRTANGNGHLGSVEPGDWGVFAVFATRALIALVPRLLDVTTRSEVLVELTPYASCLERIGEVVRFDDPDRSVARVEDYRVEFPAEHHPET
jgi:hypothetical protein